MLKGDKVGLRARHEDDIPGLRAELYDDVVNASRAEGGPWRPITPGVKDPQLVVDDTKEASVPFSVVELAGGTLVGTATLWGIDLHNRCAHIGLGLRLHLLDGPPLPILLSKNGNLRNCPKRHRV